MLRRGYVGYFISKVVAGTVDDVETQIRERLSAEGFGVLTYIDVQATLKQKLDVVFKPYRILGACNPPFAYQALQAEDKIGAMLPCNVIIQEASPSQVEVAAVDPVASMMAVDNPALMEIATVVRDKLAQVVEGL